MSNSFLSSPHSRNREGTIKQDRFYRYPGLHSFGVESVYQKLFFGRDRECQELFNLVRSNRLTVLYGKSGLGKTSLLQAGIFPLLRNIHCLPLRVRLNEPGEDPMTALKNGVEAEVEREQDLDPSVELYTKQSTTTWWEYFKTAAFWRGRRPLTPVLILDQFEEIFKLHTKASRQAMAKQLGYLVNGIVPPDVLHQLREGIVSYSDQPPDIHIILSLRIEHVGELQQLFPEIPAILSRRFILLPMDRSQAEEALVKPAALAEGGFITHPFDYHENTKNLILDYLMDDDAQTIEPYQLQLQCHQVERKVAERQGSASSKAPSPSVKNILVDNQILPDASALETVVTNYYLDTIKALGREFTTEPGQYRTARTVENGARHLCEHGLLNSQGLRVSLNEEQIKDDYRLTRGDLDFLVERRLLRRERRLKVDNYELAHDSLAKPILAKRRFRLSTKAKLGFLAMGVVILIIATSVFLFQRNQARDAKEEADEARKQTQRALEETNEARKKEELRAERAGEKVTELLQREKQLSQEFSLTSAKLNDLTEEYSQLMATKDNLEAANETLQSEIEKIRDEAELNIDEATRVIEANNARTIKELKDKVSDLETKLATTKDELTRVLEGKPVQQTGVTSGVNEPEMVEIQPGEFWMGSDEKDPQAGKDEFPRHKVTIRYPFLIGKYEVTFEQYDTFALATGRDLPDDRGWGRGNRPVINVSWDDAQAYTVWLSEQTGKSYRLPTEAEWEYAARAGTTSSYWWGNDVGKNKANCYDCGSEWDNQKTAPVGSFKANPWGLYDTAGNVYEWVQDNYHENYKGAPVDGTARLIRKGSLRVVRGGCWLYNAWNCRSAFRDWLAPGIRFNNLGFRVAAVQSSQ